MYEPTPFLPLVSAWLDLIAAGLEFKNRRFGPEAAEGSRFYSGGYDFFMQSLEPDKYFHVPNDRPSADSIVVTCNKAAEVVQLFGPAIYHKNPTRRPTYNEPLVVSPLALGLQPDPQSTMLYQQALMSIQAEREQANARCELLDRILNLTPVMFGLEGHARVAAVETLIKGASCLWTRPVKATNGGYTLPGTFWDSVDNLVIDPDAKSIETASWIANRVDEPVWEAERKWGLPPGYLKGVTQSTAHQFAIEVTGRRPLSSDGGLEKCDTITYWEVWSKMGVGGRVKQVRESSPQLRSFCELFGDYTYLVIAEGCPHPLNVPPWLYKGEPEKFQVGRAALQWPTPHWADTGADVNMACGDWPVELIGFHIIPGDPWPLSHLSPGMGELKFLNWFFSKIVNKIRITCRDMMVADDSIAQEFIDLLHKGADLEIVRAKLNGVKAQDLVAFLQHPQWNADIWKVFQEVADAFDKRVGLTELMYGLTDTQSRSATDAQAKSAGVSVRPDDMAQKFEMSMSRVARRELFALSWHTTPNDVLPCLGALGAMAWGKMIYAANPAEIVHKIKVRVEAGTARKPNKAQQQANMQAAMNQLFPPLLQLYQMTGMNQQINALITDWAKSLELPNADRYLFPAPPPMAPAPAAPPQK